MTRANVIRWGGPALMLGALMFMLTKARGYVDPDDSLLGYFMSVGFLAWMAGLAALYVRYAPLSGRLGKVGLGTSLVGITLLTAGHMVSFTTGPDLFILIVFGGLALALGAILFGIAALREDILPRYWKAVPLLTGLAGFAWFFTGEEFVWGVFIIPRTLFALGWLLTGFALFTDKREAAEEAAPAFREANT